MPTIAEMQPNLTIIETAATTLQAAIETLTADNKRLTDQIAAAPGGLTPAEQAALDDFAAKLKTVADVLSKLATRPGP